MDIISIIGMPVVMNSTLLNSAVVFQKGKYWVFVLKHIYLIIKSSMNNAGLPLL